MLRITSAFGRLTKPLIHPLTTLGIPKSRSLKDIIMKKDRKTELRVAIRELVTNKRRAFELNTNREVTFQEFKLYKDIYKNIEMRKID